MKKTGFTLVETLVAIAILMMAVVGPLYGASLAVNAANFSRNQLAASSLAQEGAEFVRSMRDNAFITYGYGALGDVNWWNNYFIASSGSSPYHIGQCVSPASCTYDPITSALIICSGTCPPLLLGTLYNQTSGTATIFTRSITLTSVASSPTETEELVTADVSWREFGNTFHVIITDHLTPWP